MKRLSKIEYEYLLDACVLITEEEVEAIDEHGSEEDFAIYDSLAARGLIHTVMVESENYLQECYVTTALGRIALACYVATNFEVAA